MKKVKIFLLFAFLILTSIETQFMIDPVSAVGATTSVRIFKYSADGLTLLDDQTISYQWMRDNLPHHGNGTLHYYHQGPTFNQTDKWNPNETVNLKDKGAVIGTAIKDLCDLVGGMVDGYEVMMHAVDNWTIKFRYANIYEPQDRQGVITLCWYNGEDALYGETYGVGYPSNSGYYTALQIIIMANTTNAAGQYVFGNYDMNQTMPSEEGYSHFYQDAEGFWPSTNGISGKWINAIYIYNYSAAPDLDLTAGDPDDFEFPWLSVGLWIGGSLSVGMALFLFIKKGPVPTP